MMLRRLDEAPRFGRLRRQYDWFSERHRDAFLLFQIGCFYEFFNWRADDAAEYLKLAEGRHRKGMGRGRGFHLSGLQAFLALALEMDRKIVIVRQTGRQRGRLRERRLDREILPAFAAGTVPANTSAACRGMNPPAKSSSPLKGADLPACPSGLQPG